MHRTRFDTWNEEQANSAAEEALRVTTLISLAHDGDVVSGLLAEGLAKWDNDQLLWVE